MEGRGTIAYTVVVALDDRFIEARSVRVLVTLHVQHVCHVQFPRIIVTAVIDRTTEQVLHFTVVTSVPQDPRLMHQYWDVPEKERKKRNSEM